MSCQSGYCNAHSDGYSGRTAYKYTYATCPGDIYPNQYCHFGSDFNANSYANHYGNRCSSTNQHPHTERSFAYQYPYSAAHSNRNNFGEPIHHVYTCC